MILMTWQGSRTICVSQVTLTQSDYEKHRLCLGRGFPSTREQWSWWHWKSRCDSRGTSFQVELIWTVVREKNQSWMTSLSRWSYCTCFPPCVWTSDFGKWYISSMFYFTPIGVCIGICYYLQHKASWLNQAPLFQTWCQALGMQPVGEGERVTVSRLFYSESLVQRAQWVLKAVEDLTWPWGLESASRGDSTLAQIWRMSGNLLEKWRCTVSLRCAQIKISKSKIKFQKVPASRLWSRKCFALKCWCLLVP